MPRGCEYLQRATVYDDDEEAGECPGYQVDTAARCTEESRIGDTSAESTDYASYAHGRFFGR